MRSAYCLPVDVLRRFDPTLTADDFESDKYAGSGDMAMLEAEIEDASDEFEEKTGHAFREVRVGSPGTPETYEQHGVDREKFRHGVKVYLDHRHVLPLDPSEGDALEIRIGRHRWRDITDGEGVRWSADYPTGWIRIHSGFRTPRRWNRETMDKNIRVSYRYGALGGDRGQGGETVLASQTAASETAVAVEDVSRLPRSGLVAVGGSEYVRYNGLDYPANEIEVSARGVRGTDAAEHGASERVHYCPTSIRSAVAAKAAARLVEKDNFVADLPTPDDSVSNSDKIESWTEEFEREAARHAEAHII